MSIYQTTQTETFGFSGGDDYFAVSYRDTADTTTNSLTHNVSSLSLQLPNNTGGKQIVDGSLRLKLTTQTYSDSAGNLVHSINPSDGTSVNAGSLTYQTGIAKITDWGVGANSPLIEGMVSRDAPPPVNQIVFRTPVSPVKVGTLQLFVTLTNGTELTLSTDEHGNITASIYAHGTFDYKNGIASLQFYQRLKIADNPTVNTEPWYDANHIYQIDGANWINKPLYVKPDSIYYNAVGYTFVPLNKEVIGIDPARLPIDGRVAFVDKGDYMVLSEDHTYAIADPAPNKSYNTGDVRLTALDISDKTGKPLNLTDVNINLDAGTFVLSSAFNPSNYTLPLTAVYRVADIFMAVEVDISGRVTANKMISHNYSTNAVASSVLINNGNGVVQARAHNVFTQKAWDGVFRTERYGDAATIQYNSAAYPIVVTNRSTPTDRIAVVFTGATTVNVIGETLGQIGTNLDISQDIAIINPLTSKPYFTLKATGWSQGGQNNNVLRFDLTSAMPAAWLGSAIQPHDGNLTDVYDYSVEHQANIDRERT